MESRLVEYFTKRRREKNLRLSETARRLGYKNINRGCNRLTEFEHEGRIRGDLLAKLAAVLDIDEATVQALLEEDRQRFADEWNQWASEPIRPYIVTRLIPGVYNSTAVPDELATLEEAEVYASAEGRRLHCQSWLVWTRRMTVCFDENGVRTKIRELGPGDQSAPLMRLGGKHFLLGTGVIKWPQKPPQL